jgi:hypothetical protein
MAVRDHFRLDVLVRRAAVLQEHDMELAELERKLGAGNKEDSSAAAAAARPAGQQPPGDGKTATRKGSAMWVWGLLLPTFLGFGVLLGIATAGSGSAAGGGGSPVKLALGQAPGASAASPSSSPAASSAPAESTSSPASEGSAGSTPSTSGSGQGAAASSPVAGTSGASEAGASEGGLPGSSGSGTGSGAGSAKNLPPIRHVFVVLLSDQPYASVFGPESKATYLAHTLAGKGELLVRYYAVAHEELASEAALISGQGPTPQTAANCPSYSAIAPATIGGIGQVLGEGCVYPRSTETLADQLAAKHRPWRAYIEGLGAGSPSSAAGCQHPALGASDPTSEPGAATPYATFRNPFVYFDSIVGSPTCASDDVPLTRLQGDLSSENRTPAFSYVAPDRCHDAGPTPCAPGQVSGPADTNGFLKTVVGEIMASKAYRKDGLLVITTDTAPSSGEYADSSSCCGQPKFPNLPASAGIGGLAHGGGQVGALLLSPYIKGGGVEENPYNTFSLLRTIEDFFGLAHLGYARLGEVSSLPPSLFMASASHG